MTGDFAAFTASLGQLQKHIEQGSAAALKAHADDVLKAANAEGVVPFKSGDLMRSGLVDGPFAITGSVGVTISYDTPYALKIHERAWPGPEGSKWTGKPKWLEMTITEKAPDMGNQLRKAIG